MTYSLNTFQAVLCLSMICLLQPASAADDFTPAQMALLAKLMKEHDACVRTEVEEEIRTHIHRDAECANVFSVAENHNQSQPQKKVQIEPSTREVTVPTPSRLLLGNRGEAPADRQTDQAASRFEITAGTDSSKATLNLSKENSSSIAGDTGHMSSWSASLSAPVNKNDSKTNIATLDGLANSTSLTIGFHEFIATGLRFPLINGDLDPNFENICRIAGIDTEKNETCDSEHVKPGLEKAHRSDLYPVFMSYLFSSTASHVWTYGAAGKIGQEEYDFFLPTTLASQSTKKVPWSASIYGGVGPINMPAFFSAGAEFQHQYTAKKSKVLCPTTAGSSPIQCVNGSIGAPTAADKHLLYVEGRSDLGFAAVDLRVTHDFASGDNGVDVPVYLFHDSKSSWTGGIRLGWTNTDHGTAGIFVGNSFSLTP